MTYLKPHTDNPKPILGYTTRRHLLLDIDNISELKAIQLAKDIMKQYPKVGDCLLVLSSIGSDDINIKYSRFGRPLLIAKRNSYHLIFNNEIGYNTCTKICQVLAGLQILERDYVKIREFRGDMTLRVSPSVLMSVVKILPTPVTLIPNPYTMRSDYYIMYYLDLLRIAHRLFRRYRRPSFRRYEHR